MVESLGRLPGAACTFGLLLQVSPRQVQSCGIAPDVMRLRLRRVDVPAAATDRHDQFDLMAEVAGARRIRQHAARLHHRAGRLHEPGRHVARALPRPAFHW